jgi:2-dehydropantoate 2-reductase
MRFAVFGVGAVGGYFGGRLAEAGEEVVFIARGSTLETLRHDGLRVDSINGDFVLRPVHATSHPAEVGPVDAILVAVKAWQVPEVVETMKPLMGPETVVVPLQNGVDAPARLAQALGAEHVLGGLCRIYSFIVAPGHICHAGAEPTIVFNELDNHPTDRVERLRQAFERAGVQAEVPSDIHAALWEKLLFVSSWGSVGALTRVPIGVLSTMPETRALLEQVMIEIWNVARACNIALQDGIVPETMDALAAQTPDATTALQRDVMEGRPSELEAQTGAVVRLGEEAGILTPLHRIIFHALLPQERGARGEL